MLYIEFRCQLVTQKQVEWQHNWVNSAKSPKRAVPSAESGRGDAGNSRVWQLSVGREGMFGWTVLEGGSEGTAGGTSPGPALILAG